MAIVLGGTPNPCPPSTVFNVAGTGFPNLKTRLALDGVGVTTNVFRPRADGSFAVGVAVGAAEATQVLTAEQQQGTKWVKVATLNIVVKKPVVVPTNPTITAGPTATPTANGAVIAWSLSKPWTGQIDFGLTSAYGMSSLAETSFNYATHQQTLTGLLPGTYHYRVRDAAGTAYASPDQTFVVAAVVTPPPPPPPTNVTYPTPRTLTAVPVNNDPKPAMGAVITDSITGTKIRRISPDGHQNQYAKHQAWSKNRALIYMQFGNIYEVATNTFLGPIASGGEFPIWSNIEPETMYGALNGYGPKFGRWTRATGWQTYHDFAADGYNWIAVGNYEGTFSVDDKVHILAKKPDGSSWMFVYDIPRATMGLAIERAHPLKLDAHGLMAGPAIQRAHPNGSSISQSGKYVVLNYDGTGTGPNQGAWLLRDDMTVVRQLEGGKRWGGYVGHPLGHQDFGYSQNGTEVLVYIEPGGSYVMSQELVSGAEYIVAGGIFGVGHVSCACYERPGVAVLSSNSFYPGAYGVNQAVAVNLMAKDNPDPPMGEVFSCLHDINPATSQVYDYSAHVSASRDCADVIWGTVWLNSGTGPMITCIAGMAV